MILFFNGLEAIERDWYNKGMVTNVYVLPWIGKTRFVIVLKELSSSMVILFGWVEGNWENWYNKGIRANFCVLAWTCKTRFVTFLIGTFLLLFKSYHISPRFNLPTNRVVLVYWHDFKLCTFFWFNIKLNTGRCVNFLFWEVKFVFYFESWFNMNCIYLKKMKI